MSPSKLAKLLQKEDVTENDVESLKDYKYLILAQPNDADERGFMTHYTADHGFVLAPKDKFILTNIEHAISKFEKKDYSAKNLVGIAVSRKSGNKEFAELGNVSNDLVEKIKKETGVDVAGYTHSLDESAVRHIIKEHGDDEYETSRGQIAVTHDDLANISSIISNPDTVAKGKDDNTIEVSKRIGEHIYVAQEIRTGRKKLAVVTMWKKPLSAHDAPQNESSAETPETDGKQTSPASKTIPQSPKNATDKDSQTEDSSNSEKTNKSLKSITLDNTGTKIMTLSIMESRAISKQIRENLISLNGGVASIMESRKLSKAINDDLALLNGGTAKAVEKLSRRDLTIALDDLITNFASKVMYMENNALDAQWANDFAEKMVAFDGDPKSKAKYVALAKELMRPSTANQFPLMYSNKIVALKEMAVIMASFVD
jgi:hypothetical protein